VGLCLGLEAACTKEKKDLAFSVKGGVAEPFGYLVLHFWFQKHELELHAVFYPKSSAVHG